MSKRPTPYPPSLIMREANDFSLSNFRAVFVAHLWPPFSIIGGAPSYPWNALRTKARTNSHKCYVTFILYESYFVRKGANFRAVFVAHLASFLPKKQNRTNRIDLTQVSWQGAFVPKLRRHNCFQQLNQQNLLYIIPVYHNCKIGNKMMQTRNNWLNPDSNWPIIEGENCKLNSKT